jgi:hypothetical protein
MFDQVIISFIGRVYRYAAFTPKGYVSFHPSQYHVGPFSGLHAIQERGEEEGHRGYQATRREVLYFFWPVAPERVSEMLWPALLAMSWACFMTPWPWLDASSPPERVASPSFCPVDFWPSGSRRVSYMFPVFRRERGRGALSYQAGRRRQCGHRLR